MKLLVTGGAGYIGSIVAKRLIGHGHEVTVLDDLSRGHRAAVPEDAAFEYVNLLDGPSLQRALIGGYDGVLHFAALALVPESVQHPERYWRTNVVGTLNLLDAMRTTGVRRLVFSSTCATYGEPDEVPIGETTPTAPTNPYGASKLTVDRMIADEAAAHGLGAISLRYFNVAGASGHLGEDHEPETHIIPLVLRAAAGRAWRHAQASAIIASRSFSGSQPSSARTFSLEATSWAGSPGRRGSSLTGISRPVTSRAMSITWRTEWPRPLPRL